MLDVDLSHLPEVIGDHERECDPFVVPIGVHAKDDHEEDQFPEECQLDQGVVAEEADLSKILQVSIDRLPSRIFCVDRHIPLVHVTIEALLELLAHYRQVR